MPIVLMLAAVAATPLPKTPAEAIAIADAHPDRGTTGRYAMTVAATERTLKAVFLNSAPDYRAPDDLTFAISLPAARALEKRFGARPETFMRGKHIVVDGAVAVMPIATVRSGAITDHRTFRRVQHQVQIDRAEQVVSVD